MLVDDAGYGSHEVARFCCARRGRRTLVSKLHPDANLYTPAPRYAGQGRPRAKGQRLPKPHQAVAAARRLRRLRVGWYGGGQREVAVKTGTGHWYKAGRGLVSLRWVFVRDKVGTHRDEYFYTTDPALTPTQVITLYTGRWNIETTFQEARAHLGLETTRGWCRNTVRRAAPCLLGLYTAVTLVFAALHEAQHFLQGEAMVTLQGDRHDAKPGTWVHMPAGLKHSIQARTPVVMLLLLLK